MRYGSNVGFDAVWLIPNWCHFSSFNINSRSTKCHQQMCGKIIWPFFHSRYKNMRWVLSKYVWHFWARMDAAHNGIRQLNMIPSRSVFRTLVAVAADDDGRSPSSLHLMKFIASAAQNGNGNSFRFIFFHCSSFVQRNGKTSAIYSKTSHPFAVRCGRADHEMWSGASLAKRDSRSRFVGELLLMDADE